MFKKETFKSKFFWLGVATVIYGGVEAINGDQANGVQKIMIGLGMIFGRDTATKIIEKKVG